MYDFVRKYMAWWRYNIPRTFEFSLAVYKSKIYMRPRSQAVIMVIYYIFQVRFAIKILFEPRNHITKHITAFSRVPFFVCLDGL